ALRCEPLGSGPVYSQLDGEPAGQLPAHFEVLPDAITLVVPQIIGARLACERDPGEIAVSNR
ncbi:MAG TPA: hypothetical protein VN862_03190, partial [Candidatus Acidoferrales bacterium]|nr:hypothetical protein [Candidatus Acidoferrales bacterium]